MTRNQKAWLEMIAYAEIGYSLLDVSNDGYDVLCSSTAARPYLFYDYSKHPRRYMQFSARITSSAAGRYQFLYDTWLGLTKDTGLTDFSPTTQDIMALKLADQRGAMPYINQGYIEEAVWRCRKIWASFPGAGYGQGEKKIDSLLMAYYRGGGILIGGSRKSVHYA